MFSDQSAGEPPVSIPTTVVKPRCADGTAPATAWERRSSLNAFSGILFYNEEDAFFVSGVIRIFQYFFKLL